MKKKIAIIISCVFVGVLVLGTLGFGIYELTRSTKVSTLKDTYSTTINGDQDGNILYDNLSVLQKIDVLNVFESIANEMVGYDNEVKQIINKNPIVNNDIVKVFE